MPIYEYECSKCGVFEVSQRITADPLRKCPTCRSKVKKLISNTSFQLKGSGWYVTDYARKDGGGKEAKEAKESKESKESKEGKETKDSKAGEASSAESKTKASDSGSKKKGPKTTSAAAA
jgi:putative FmdB family regulatory protein